MADQGMKVIASIAPVLVLVNINAFAQQRGTASQSINYETAWMEKNVKAVRITERITLDGRLEEPAWSQAIPATDFTQWARPGVPATNKTEAKFLYDDDNLYVAVNCWDNNIEKRVVHELREDFGFRETEFRSGRCASRALLFRRGA